MTAEIQTQQNELILSPRCYAYTQDTTTGVIKIHTGPNVLNTTGQEFPIVFDPVAGRFRKVPLMESAQPFAAASQGQYIVLENPAIDGEQPQEKDKRAAADLNMGRKIIVQGPINFALWPSQKVTVIEGHNLRSNQYLRIRVYDEESARENWSKAVIKAAQTSEDDAKGKKESKHASKKSLFDEIPEDLAVGKHYIVRGDEFSFYIPPTGVEVLQDIVGTTPNSTGEYVREAVTLESLEYCILIDENGRKRYESGPQVVFPVPTERFFEETDKKGIRYLVFKPIELNEIQGIHVKVIADYTENNVEYKEGQELFIRGSETPIYFPRVEHAPVKYDGKFKHFATAVPEGEARYVLERKNGRIRTMKGPQMMLPDPRNEVIVRRVLSDKQCQLWYPGNVEAQKYNATLREMMRFTPSTRGDSVSEGEITRSKKIRSGSYANVAGFADQSLTHSDSMLFGMDEFSRKSTYTEPRTVTLDTKFGGVPSVDIWTGYAVMVVDKRGNRRVEVGPKTLLMEYDESLEVLEMSTSKPKNTDTLMQTAFLRVKNNQVGDIITAETADHVNVGVKVSLRVNFMGEASEERSKWFEAENYVKLLCDHVRSMVKADIRRRKIEDLYADPSSFVRDAIMGQKGEDGNRPGLSFPENGMVVVDVEVLNFKVGDERIGQMLDNTQHSVVESNIALVLAEKKLVVDKKQEIINRERIGEQAKTKRVELQLRDDVEVFSNGLATGKVERDLTLQLQELNAGIAESEKKQEMLARELKLLDDRQESDLSRKDAIATFDLKIDKAKVDLDLEKIRAETASVVERFGAIEGNFTEALVTLGNQDVLIKVSEAMSIQHMLGGKNLVDVIQKALAGTPIETLMKGAMAKAVPSNGAVKSAKGAS